MDQTKLSAKETVEYYKEDVTKLLAYLSYFQNKKAADVSRNFDSEMMGNTTLRFPVYDSSLLSFVKLVNQTVFINQNYRYVYSRLGLRTHEDERRAIQNATIQDMEVLGGILSKYVLGGMTRGAVWTEAVEEGIFTSVIEKARDLIVYWDKPIV